MKVLNKTDKELKIRVTDRYGHMYSIYLPGGRSTDLAPNQVSKDVLDFIKLGYLKDISEESTRSYAISKNIIENPVTVECACSVDHHEEIVDEGSATQDTSDDSNENSVIVDEDSATVEHEETSEQSTSVYKCEFCGSEFASPRGLSMHKNRSHPNELNKEV